MISEYDGMTGNQIERLSPAKRRKMWEKDRQTVADKWFRGDVERAQAAFDALPYSSIPDWTDLDRVAEALAPADQGPTFQAAPPTPEEAAAHRAEREFADRQARKDRQILRDLDMRRSNRG